MSKRKRILFVAMSDSVHAARWISQICNQTWDIYLFPIFPSTLHPLFHDITYFNSDILRSKSTQKNIQLIQWPSPFFYWDFLQERLRRISSTHMREVALSLAIRQIKPDLIHSLEFQHSAYMTMAVLRRLKNVPSWHISNWGSDISLFGRLANDRERVQAILQSCDYYSCECERDIKLAHNLGLRGKVMPVLPNAGGIDVQEAIQFRSGEPVSARRVILLKGYQHWAGRALFGLQALRLCADLLKEYTINVYSVASDVKISAELFALDTGIAINIIPPTSHDEMLRLYGLARIYIGLSISDGISTSLLEAMVMGAFPIQSCTACADEWIEHGKSGYIVPPEDPYVLADAIRQAVKDDSLVDSAAEINLRQAKEKLDISVIQPQVVSMYKENLSKNKEEK